MLASYLILSNLYEYEASENMLGTYLEHLVWRCIGEFLSAISYMAHHSAKDAIVCIIAIAASMLTTKI